MKNLSLILLSCFLTIIASAQINDTDLEQLRMKEDLMKPFATAIIRGETPEARAEADSIFTRMFVQALKTPYSFYYPFDSLITISRLVPKDSSFRIITWQLVINDDVVRKHGAIQVNTPDGSLKLFPLIDKSGVIADQEESVVDNFSWVGALYYMIVEKQFMGKNFYTLLGYDENDSKSNRKLIDVLTFKNGTPVFGGNYFNFPDTSLNDNMTRYIITYKKYASPRLTYDSTMDMIVIEHTISETNEPDKKYTYIPDGDYEGMKWEDGRWVHINKVFTYITPEGKEPVPDPLYDGKSDTNNKLKVKQN